MLEDIHRLPADQREALVLFELGSIAREIAAVLGVRKEKVKALVFQAREALVRGRRARGHPCAEIREWLAMSQGDVLPRRSHAPTSIAALTAPRSSMRSAVSALCWR